MSDPIILLEADLGRGSLIRHEPVTANDRVYLRTRNGWVVMLEPDPS